MLAEVRVSSVFWAWLRATVFRLSRRRTPGALPRTPIGRRSEANPGCGAHLEHLVPIKGHVWIVDFNRPDSFGVEWKTTDFNVGRRPEPVEHSRA